jgi:hypothetical protein
VQEDSYVPRPIDTSNVQLSAPIRELAEKLARNTHEVWAKKRLQDGWTYGQERNDAAKKHPDLVAYDELTEGEKSYDREVVSEVIKVILALGYTIEKKQ